jgi:hypothetical protein
MEISGCDITQKQPFGKTMVTDCCDVNAFTFSQNKGIM